MNTLIEAALLIFAFIWVMLAAIAVATVIGCAISKEFRADFLRDWRRNMKS